MLNICMSRGFISSTDIGINKSYYLYNNEVINWLLSPVQQYTSRAGALFSLMAASYLYDRSIHSIDGGVQNFYRNFYVIVD